MLMMGETPWHESRSYADILRPQANNENETHFSVDEFVKGYIEADKLNTMDGINNEDTSDSPTYDKASTISGIISRKNRPIIKIHGSLDTSNALVWTRTGYRRLLHFTPGYASFLRTVLSTCTVLYLGFSFSDGYINEIRGEVLSMPYGDASNRSSETSLPPPIGYAIVHDKDPYEIEFFERHEGVRMLTWSTKVPNSTVRDYSGLDRYLQTICNATSFIHYIGKSLVGKRVLLVEWSRANHQRTSTSQTNNHTVITSTTSSTSTDTL